MNSNSPFSKELNKIKKMKRDCPELQEKTKKKCTIQLYQIDDAPFFKVKIKRDLLQLLKNLEVCY